MPNRIILIEDNPEFGNTFVKYFQQRGYQVKWFRDYDSFHEFKKLNDLREYSIFTDFNFPMIEGGEYFHQENLKLMLYVFESGFGLNGIVGNLDNFSKIVATIREEMILPLNMTEEGSRDFYGIRDLIMGSEMDKDISETLEKIKDKNGLKILTEDLKDYPFVANIVLHFCAQKLLPAGLLVIRDCLAIGHKNFFVLTERSHRIGIDDFFPNIKTLSLAPISGHKKMDKKEIKDFVLNYVERHRDRIIKYFYSSHRFYGMNFLKIESEVVVCKIWKMIRDKKETPHDLEISCRLVDEFAFGETSKELKELDLKY